MESVLVNFYNLELDTHGIEEIGVVMVGDKPTSWRTPEPDRKKIMEFFEKHAPEVLRYQTAGEIEAPQKPLGAEMIGTLGYFEYRRKQSWFDSDAFNFDVDYKRLHELVDLYLEGEELPDHVDAWIKSLLNDVRMGVHRIEGKNGKVSYAEHLVAITSTSSDPLKVQVALGKMCYQLCREIISVLNGETEIRRCEAEDCDRVFNPSLRGKEQRYCSMRCRKRSYMKEYRKNFS